MDSVVKELENIGIHSVVSGFASAGVAVAMGATGSVPFMGVSVPLPLIFGAVGAVSSGVQKGTRDQIVPLIVKNPDINTLLYVLSPAIQGVAFAGIDFGLNFLMGNDYLFEDAVSAFMIGGLSALVASFAEKPVEKYLDVY